MLWQHFVPPLRYNVRSWSLCSSSVSSCLSRVYQSLANLIRWSDQVMLEGVNLEEKDTVANVTSIIKAVLDGVKVITPLYTPLAHLNLVLHCAL